MPAATPPSSSVSSVFLPPSAPTAPPSAPAPAYQLTSQYASWTFAPSTLAALRQSAWSAARDRLAQQWADELALSPGASQPVYPSHEALQLLVTSYLAKLRGLTKVLGVPEVVEEYAATYLKRYYVRKSELEGDVRGIMLTCVYLSLKSTSHALPLSRFASLLAGRGANARSVAAEIESSVRALEFGVADALGWELVLHTPGEALKGLILDLQTLEPSPLPLLRKLLPRAQALLALARLTRLELSYSASHIALACLRSAGSGEAEAKEQEAHDLVRRWLEAKEEAARKAGEAQRREKAEWRAKQAARQQKKNGEPSSPTALGEDAISTSSPLGLSLSAILDLLERISEAIFAQEERAREAKANAPEGSKGPFVVDIEEVRRIDAELKACGDPEGKEGSALNKRKRQAEEEALASKRARKAEAVKAASGPDPFGSAPLLAPSLGDALDAGGKEEGSGGGGLFGREIERRKKQEKQGVDSDEDVPMLAGAVQK